MSAGFKIKKLREQKDLSQYSLAIILNISQSELSKIENGQTKKIDFLLMYKVCTYFDTNLDFFIEKEHQINKKQELGSDYNVSATTIFFPEKIIEDIKKLIEDNKQKTKLIEILRKK